MYKKHGNLCLSIIGENVLVKEKLEKKLIYNLKKRTEFVVFELWKKEMMQDNVYKPRLDIILEHELYESEHF